VISKGSNKRRDKPQLVVYHSLHKREIINFKFNNLVRFLNIAYWIITCSAAISQLGCARPTPELFHVQVNSPIDEIICVQSNAKSTTGGFEVNRKIPDSLFTTYLKLHELDSRGKKRCTFSAINDNYYIHLNRDSLNQENLQLIKDSISAHQQCKRYFILSENMIWCNNRSLFCKVQTEQSRIGEYRDNNFWTELEPMFNKLEQDVYFIGGGMARDTGDDGYLYFAYENIHLIGTGIGESLESNALKINIHEDDRISIEVHAEYSDSIFDLKTYKLPFSRQRKSSLKPFFQKLNEDSY